MADAAGGYAEYGFVAEYYDYVVPYAAREDVAFFVDTARHTGGPVLEVGCGTGRVLIPTARSGFEITGIDLSPAMLATCRTRLAAESPDVRARVKLYEADMRGFDLGQEFALVTLPFRPFQHLTSVEDQMTCLQTLRRHLRSDGRLVLDLFNPSIKALADDSRFEEQSAEPEFTMPDGRRVLRTYRTVERDLFNQIQQVEMYYNVTHPDGSQERLVHAFPMRWLYRFEAEHLLSRCGFEVERLYGGYDRSEFGAKSLRDGPRPPGELIFVARKARV